VQGLYNVLMCAAWCDGPGLGGGGGAGGTGGRAAAPPLQDVPTLLSPVPFEGAALCAVPLQVLPTRAAAAGVARQQQQPNTATATFHAESCSAAPIAPWVLQRALAVLGPSHASCGGLDVFVDAMPGTGMLNVKPDAWARLFSEAAGKGAGAGGAAGVAAELAASVLPGGDGSSSASALAEHRDAISGRTIKMARWGNGGGGGGGEARVSVKL